MQGCCGAGVERGFKLEVLKGFLLDSSLMNFHFPVCGSAQRKPQTTPAPWCPGPASAPAPKTAASLSVTSWFGAATPLSLYSLPHLICVSQLLDAVLVLLLLGLPALALTRGS